MKTEKQIQILLLKVDPRFTFRNNFPQLATNILLCAKLITRGEKRQTLTKNKQRNNVARQVEVFCISYFAAFKQLGCERWRRGLLKFCLTICPSLVPSQLFGPLGRHDRRRGYLCLDTRGRANSAVRHFENEALSNRARSGRIEEDAWGRGYIYPYLVCIPFWFLFFILYEGV